MSSGITFSGANGIDWNMILNAVMAQEQLPLTTIQTQRQSLTTKSTAFGTLATKLGALGTASDALKDSSAFGGRSVATTDATRVTASAGTDSIPGIYDVVVRELARAQVTASSSTHAATDIVATAGTPEVPSKLTIGGVAVTVTGDLTLQGLADAINSTADIGVAASIVSPASGRYQLVLTGTDTGSAEAFTITNGLAGTTLAFLDTDVDGISGDSAADNAVNATDALVDVNNVTVSASTNVIDDAVPGTTLTLLKKDPATTVTVSVTKNDETTKAKVQKFVDTYNDLVTFAQQQTSSSSGIGRDPLLRQLRNELRSLVSSQYDTGGSYTALAEIGVGFDRSGKLSLDTTLFNAAMSSSAVDVQRLFVGDGATAGVFESITSAIDEYTDAGALIANSRDRINEQIVALDGRLLAMENRLALRRVALQKEYMAADQMMSQLSSQASSLSSLDNQYRLF
jgi:flagellar hook-associated protein 2